MFFDVLSEDRSDVICRGCDERLFVVGDSLYCGMVRCDRYCQPVDAEGRNEEEAQAHAIAPLIPEEVESDR
jgi:hypothetical protein